MTTDEVCLVCKKGNKDTFKHLAHAHLTCVMTEIQKARQDERVAARTQFDTELREQARKIFAELEKAAEKADDNDDEDIVICKFGEACDEDTCVYHKIKKKFVKDGVE